jgi:hypothetical protein
MIKETFLARRTWFENTLISLFLTNINNYLIAEELNTLEFSFIIKTAVNLAWVWLYFSPQINLKLIKVIKMM